MAGRGARESGRRRGRRAGDTARAGERERAGRVRLVGCRLARSRSLLACGRRVGI